jgi:cytochrome c-type biogenesis protein CcmE
MTTTSKKGLTRKQKRLVMIAGLGVVLSFAAFLIFTALRDKIVFFYTPTEIMEKNVGAGQPFRLGGLVQEGSWQKDGKTNNFVVSDGENEIKATFVGILPDLFREGQGVIAEGHITQAGIFDASEVLAKHDENYIPAELADELKARGEWRPDAEGTYDASDTTKAL